MFTREVFYFEAALSFGNLFKSLPPSPSHFVTLHLLGCGTPENEGRENKRVESTDRKESDLWGERGRCGAALKSNESVCVCEQDPKSRKERALAL